jgi:hypothetical protein
MDETLAGAPVPPDRLPPGAVHGDPPGWRLVFRLCDLVRGEREHFVRFVILIAVGVVVLATVALVLGPWMASGLGAATALTRAIRHVRSGVHRRSRS